MQVKDLIQIPMDISDLLYKATFIDVRSSNEFIHGHIKQARNIPFEQIEASIHLLNDLPKPLIFYSSNGTRSERACDIVNDVITEVYNGGSYIKLEQLLESFKSKSKKESIKKIRISSPPKNIRDYFK